MNILEVHEEMAKKYSKTVDHATYHYITETISWLKAAGEDPKGYELVMVSKRHIDDPMMIEWTLSIRKKATVGIVD